MGKGKNKIIFGRKNLMKVNEECIKKPLISERFFKYLFMKY